MSFQLNEIQELIQQNTRDFAKEYIEPIAGQTDKENSFPQKVVEQLAGNDYFGLFLPEEFGGSEAGYLSFVLAVEEMAKVSAGVAAILINQSALAGYALNKWGTPDQKKSYLSSLITGEKLGAFALAEPGAAPGAGPNKLTAVKDGGDYILNGRKSYVANGGQADFYLVFGVTDEEDPSRRMSSFIIETQTPGFSVTRTIGKMGQRACPWAELSFENVRVTAGQLLGNEGEGSIIAQEAKAVANVAEGALVIGVAQAGMEEAANYAKQRIQFGQPIANFPAIRNMLAEMSTNIHLARLAVYDAANMIEQGKNIFTEAAMIKLFVSRIGQNSLIDAVQVHGGYGFSEDMVVSRYYRDVKGSLLIDGSADLPESFIAADLLD
ncbi:MAG: acyl-CoA dehydrogenase [Peptococcaceae bacterium]|nr:acyl-CoA dehydrogenase [Peptococcaceae bacterium]